MRPAVHHSDARPGPSEGVLANSATRAKISAAMRGKIPWNKGKRASPAARAKMRASQRRRFRDPAERAKLSVAQRGRFSDAERALSAAREKFKMHRGHAKGRGIPFRMTFEERMHLWQQSGRWHRRGNRRGFFVMARNGDRGGYEVGNVRICLFEENRAEQKAVGPVGNRNHLGHRHGAASRAKMSAAQRRRMSDPAERAKNGAAVRRALSDPAVRAKISAANRRRRGEKRSAVTRAKISASLRRRRGEPSAERAATQQELRGAMP